MSSEQPGRTLTNKDPGHTLHNSLLRLLSQVTQFPFLRLRLLQLLLPPRFMFRLLKSSLSPTPGIPRLQITHQRHHHHRSLRHPPQGQTREL